MTIAFVTFGCRLNRAEALDLESKYAAAGWGIANLPQGASKGSLTSAPDVIAVRACSVTAKAQRDCEKKIAQLRRRFPNTQILLTGCHPDAKPIPPRLAPPAFADSATPVNRQLSRAYLKVQDGCSGKCAFCIVPAFRGKPESVQFGNALARARAYLDSGFREIVVTGCNLCLYRDAGRRLPDLISALAELESPGHRIRLGSIEPGLCDEALLDAMESHPNICRFLHLSLQSGSNRILRLMRRPYTAEHVAGFCNDARRRLGETLALGADVITGFPGETAEDFSETKSFLSAPKLPPQTSHLTTSHSQRTTYNSQLPTYTSQLTTFNFLHVFPYSERAGTEAAAMTPAVPVEIRRKRAKELEALGAANREAFARSFIGKEVEVCIEKDGNGYSGEYVHCVLDGDAPRRSLAKARVVDYFPKTGSLSATIRA